MVYSLADILPMLSEEAWHTISSHTKIPYKVDQPVPLKKLATRLSNPVYLADALHGLSSQENEIFERWMLGAREDYTVPAVGIGAAALATAAKLGERGLLYQLQTPFGWYYAFPSEVIPGLLYILLKNRQAIGPMLAPHRSSRSAELAPLWWSLVHNVFMVLSHAKREPLPLAQQGYVYKRVTNKLVSKSWEHLKDSDRIDMAIYFARRLGLLGYQAEDYRMLAPTTNVLSFWQQSGEDILRIARNTIETRSNPVIQNILWTVLGHLEPDQWMDLDALHRWAIQEKIAGYSVYTRDYLVNEAVALGILEIDKRFCRYTDVAYWGSRGRFETVEVESIVIQPTGEVLVPPSAPYADRWTVDALATPVKWDRMGVYQIDRKSVESIIDRGVSLEAYLAAWQGLSRTGIPANVQTNIQDWYRTLNRHRVLRATLIHSQDPVESTKVEQILKKAKQYHTRLSAQDLIISEASLAAVRKALERAGIPLSASVDTPGKMPNIPDGDLDEFDEFDEFDDFDGPADFLADTFDAHHPHLVRQAVLPGDPLVPVLDTYTIQSIVREAMADRSPVTVYYLKNPDDQGVTRTDLVSAYIKDRHVVGVDIHQQAFYMPLERIRSAARTELP